MFVRRSTYENLLHDHQEHCQQAIDEACEYEIRIGNLVDKIESIQRDNEELLQNIAERDAEIERLSNLYENSDENSITVKMSENFLTGTPVIRYRGGAGDALVLEGFLNSNQVEDKFQIQLAMISCANEIFNQILSSYQEPVSRGDYEDFNS